MTDECAKGKMMIISCILQTLGNHEFDNGIAGLVPYLEHLKSKVVIANIIDDEEPTMQGLYEKSIIVEKNGRRIGIIGVLIATTNVSGKPNEYFYNVGFIIKISRNFILAGVKF